MITDPVRIFISHASVDQPFVEELFKHLSPLVRAQILHVRHASIDDVDAVRRAQEFASANAAVFLLSADFLASDQAFEDFDLARRHEARIVPVIVRACDWSSTPFGKFQALPRDLPPIASWSDRDAAWAAVVAEIRAVVQFSAERMLSQDVRPDVPPREIRPIGDIFRTFGQPDITYVDPAQLPRLRIYMRTMGQGLVIEGPSAVGKTTVVRSILAGQTTPREWLLGHQQKDREILDERLRNGFSGYLVVDDFHRLDRSRQEQVALAMKTISDRDARDAKIIVIGINPVGDSLIGDLPDLAGRFEVVTMGRQPDEKVDELIRKGEEAANVLFAHRSEFILAAAGSLHTAQQLCYHAAIKVGILETRPSRMTVHVSLHEVLAEVLPTLHQKYFGLLRNFACHDERTPPRGATLALLWLLGRGDDGHVSLDDVRYQFPDTDVHDALVRLKSSYLAKCFDDHPGLKSLFYYNKGAGIVSIEDPRLGFYLRHTSWPDFIEKTGHRNARIDVVESKLVFSKRSPSDKPPVPDETFNILHLSDLHFNQRAQADVWYGQLAEDLREMECNHLEAVVVSGDLTQTGEPFEFDCVRAFLDKLIRDFRLSPKRFVIVPGNHDLQWSKSKSAYQLHRRSDYARMPDEGTFIMHGAEVIEVRDDTRHRERFDAFRAFLTSLRSDDPNEFELVDLERENILFLGLNSSWDIDHHFRGRASIHPGTLAEALEKIRTNSVYDARVKIAVWHHPIAGRGEDRIKDHGFLQQLAKAGFRLALHGHIHRAENALFRYDMTPDGRKIDIISAGTFGAPTHEWVPGFPLQYNLLRIDKQKVSVETRRREEPNGAWQPDSRWGRGKGKDPMPRYEVVL